MHDLDIVYPHRPLGAVEVTSAADAESIELWNLMNGDGRWLEPNLVGGWSVALVPSARAGRLRAELPAMLRRLEQAGVREVRDEPWQRGPFDDATRALGITHLLQGETDYPGSIYPTIDLPPERSGGVVADTGDALVQWIDEWIRRPDVPDNLQKLERSGAAERHLFVVVPGLTDAPFGIVDLLLRDSPPLPTVAPDLPAQVTHAWVMSTWNSGSGMRWSPDGGWQHFDKQLDQPEKQV